MWHYLVCICTWQDPTSIRVGVGSLTCSLRWLRCVQLVDMEHDIYIYMTCRVWPLVICHRATSNLLQFQDLSSLPGPKCSLHLPIPSSETRGILLEFATTFHLSTKNHSLSPIMNRWSQKLWNHLGFKQNHTVSNEKLSHGFPLSWKIIPMTSRKTNPQLAASPQGPEDFGGFKITHLRFATGGYPNRSFVT